MCTLRPNVRLRLLTKLMCPAPESSILVLRPLTSLFFKINFKFTPNLSLILLIVRFFLYPNVGSLKFFFLSSLSAFAKAALLP
ncbi:MAG: hypothetical protein WCW13_00265 [archaeon]